MKRSKTIKPEKGQNYANTDSAQSDTNLSNVIKINEARIQSSAFQHNGELLEWIGDEFDPEAFDVKEVNDLLRHL